MNGTTEQSETVDSEIAFLEGIERDLELKPQDPDSSESKTAEQSYRHSIIRKVNNRQRSLKTLKLDGD